MKITYLLLFLASISLKCFSQQSPVNDTLLPEQHKHDTVQYEPKLDGGALIDTINTKDKKLKNPPSRIQKVPKNPPQKNDSVEKKLGIKPGVPGSAG
jgi:hypothetical protein